MTATDLNGDEIDRDATEESEGEGVDAKQVKEIVGFVWHSTRRRPSLAASVFVIIAGLGLTAAAAMPRIYNAQVKLLAQRDFVMPALSNPGRAVPREADNPTRNVAASIMRRDNLVALVREANLVENWRASRSTVLRLKDAVLGGLPKDEEETALAQTLEKRTTVLADDSSVTISIDWTDPQLAYELVQRVQKNFVDARYDSEVTMIQEAISVLEEHAKTELEQVDSALTAYQALRSNELTGAPPSTAATVLVNSVAKRTPTAPSDAPIQPAAVVDEDLTKKLEEKRRQIRALEDSRQRTLETLKQQLVQAQLTLTEMHPTVIALQQKIDSLRDPPPELADLKSEERDLMSRIVPPTGSSTPPSRTNLWNGAAPDSRTSPARQADVRSGPDPALAPAKSRLDAAIYRYQGVMANIDSAKLELDITRAAFRYRYSVITPAEIPHGPKRPITLLVRVASVVGGAILAMLGAAAADWKTGRILETWQIRRRLKLEVLGDFESPL